MRRRGAVGREGGGEGALGFLAHGEEGRHVVAGAASADSISATCPFLLCITNAGGFVHHLAHCVEDRYLRLAVRIVDYAIPDRLAPWENSICVFLLPVSVGIDAMLSCCTTSVLRHW